jgi:hypothetical protein
MKTGFSTKSINFKHKKILKFETSKKNKKIILERKGTWVVVENTRKTGSAENLTNGPETRRRPETGKFTQCFRTFVLS